MATPTQYAQRNPHNAGEYRDIYNYQNRTCYQILCKVVENDIEANSLILQPQYSDTTDGLAAWKALIQKYTQVSNTEKFNTIIRALTMKQEETESTEQYKIREQHIQNLIASQKITLSDIRLSVWINGLKPKYKTVVEGLMTSGQALTIDTVNEACKQFDLRFQVTNEQAVAHKAAKPSSTSTSSSSDPMSIESLAETIASSVTTALSAALSKMKPSFGHKSSKHGGDRHHHDKTKKYCKYHPNSTTHNTKECKYGPKAAAESESSNQTHSSSQTNQTNKAAESHKRHVHKHTNHAHLTHVSRAHINSHDDTVELLD